MVNVVKLQVQDVVNMMAMELGEGWILHKPFKVTSYDTHLIFPFGKFLKDQLCYSLLLEYQPF